MKINIKGFSTIYIFFIIMFILSLWVIVINKNNMFQNKFEYDFLQQQFWKKFNNKYIMYIQSHLNTNTLNSDGTIKWWSFRDMRNCPSNIKYLSWSEMLYQTLPWVITQQKENDDYFCKWVLDNKDIKLYYTDDLQNYEYIKYDDINYLTWISIWDLWDNKTIQFDMPDSLNNDSENRKNIYWNVWGNSYEMIFWNNDKIKDFIDKNPNNNSPLTKKLSEIEEWIIWVFISRDSSLKIIKWNKEFFEEQWRLQIEEEIELNIWDVGSSGKYWYIDIDISNNFNIYQNYLDWTYTKTFDFKNNDYSVFLKSNDSYMTSYEFRVYDKSSWSWVFINPIKDNNWYDNEYIEYLWNDIIPYDSWWYIWKMEVLK